MSDPKTITEAKQLLVEGKDAEVFFAAMIKHMKLPGIQIQDFGGNSQLRNFLKALKNVSGFR
ncbi:MAG: hypothetical protein IT210_25735 [Armatimonadetes bacterium]|nr:hypothetical protein [Armatimonadota bacterium]